MTLTNDMTRRNESGVAGAASPDDEDRIKDFLGRHGGAGDQARRDGESAQGLQGWSEVYARDGYVLRCDWSKMGTLEEMKYSEISPDSPLRHDSKA
jgi:hypothetical protein